MKRLARIRCSEGLTSRITEAAQEQVQVLSMALLSCSYGMFGVEYPLIWVEDRPEINDLERVLLQEGDGEGTTLWRVERSGTGELTPVLQVQVRRPVDAAFDIPFVMPRARRILTVIGRTELLFMCPGACPQQLVGQDELMGAAPFDLLLEQASGVVVIELDAATCRALLGRLESDEPRVGSS